MIKGFVSYADEDTRMCKKLLSHLKLFERANKVQFWADPHIEAGDDWNRKIIEALDTANVALFLVSGYMLASDFIWNEELPRACHRAAKGDLVIIPVILRPVIWRINHPGYCLPRMQAVPNNGVPISKHQPVDEAYKDSAKRIMRKLGIGA
jgi:TIR domain